MIHPNRKHRRSIRIPGYDYAQPGAYFITVCTFNKALLFGEITERKMHLNQDGLIVAEEWLRTETVRTNLTLDAFVVMPNHLHAIIFLNRTVGATRWVARIPRHPHGLCTGSIGGIIGQFKSVTTKRMNARNKTLGARWWQRNYYEHIIRDEGDLERIREYIVNNPEKWHLDRENPLCGSTGRTGDPPGRAVRYLTN